MKILSNILVKAGVIVDNYIAIGTDSPYAGYNIDSRGSHNFGTTSSEVYHYFQSSSVSGGSAVSIGANNLSANSARSQLMLSDASSSVATRFGLGVYTGETPYAYLDSASKLVFNNASGANVIVGNTADSGQKFQVYGSTLLAGDLTVTNANNATVNLGLIQKLTADSGTGVYKFWNGSGGGWSFEWYNNGTTAMTLNTANNLLLGTTTDNGSRLQVSGDVTASNFVASAYVIANTVWVNGSFKNNNNGNMSLAFSGTTLQLTTDYGAVLSAAGNGNVTMHKLAGSGTRMVVADANGLLSTQSFSANVNAFQEYTYTATAGQTTFAATYTVGQVFVYYNGSKLEPAEYTATDGTSIVITPGVNAGDIIDIIAYQTGAGIGYGSLSATGPLTYNSGTGAFAIQKADSIKDGYLSSTDWTTFNNKQNALTNPVTGTGTSGNLAKFTGTSTIGNSLITDNGTTVSVLGSAYDGVFRVGSSSNSLYFTPDGGGVGIAATAGGYTGQGIYLAGGAGQVEIHTNSISRIFVANDGKVGINVTNPNYPLTVGAVANDAISWRNNGVEVGRLGIDGNTSNGWMSLFNSGVTKVQISAGGVNTYFAGTGNFGVGTVDPQGKFHVDHGDTYNQGIRHTKNSTFVTETRFGRPGTGSNVSIIYDIAGTEIAEIRRNYSAAKFVLSRENATHMEITAGGIMTVPYQPAFSVAVSSNVTGPAVIPLGNVIFNDGGHYNSTTYRFTAPVAGRYFFSFYDNVFPNDTNPAQFYFRVNGTRRGAIAYTLNKGTSWYLMSFQQVIKLNAGDYVDVYNQSGDRTDYGSDTAWGNFSGYLIG